MPIKAHRSIWPPAGKPPTGIFSTRGKQKMDSTSHFKSQGTQSYALGVGPQEKPKGGSKSLRHQAPRSLKEMGNQ